MEALGNFPEAIEKFEKLVAEFPQNKPLASRALLMSGRCHEKLGRAEAKNAYNRIIEQYGDQQEVVMEARARLLALAEETPGFTIRKVMPYMGGGFGKISPDGRYLTYVNWNTGDLVIQDVTTGEERRLTDKGSILQDGAFAYHSRWSPDGKHIAFDWWDWSEPGFVGIRVVEPDGSNIRDIYRDKDPAPKLSIIYDWSPDGKDILAAILGDEAGKIVLISVSDGSMQTLKEFDFQRFRQHDINNMRFSPCGNFIIYDFNAEDSPNRDIYVLDLEEKSEFLLVEHPANDLFLEWTPDGKNVLFLSNRRESLDLWRLPMDGGKSTGAPELVKKGVGKISSQGLTGSGAFYYVTDNIVRNVYIASLDAESGKIIESPDHPIKHRGKSTHSPAYSPDGKYLAYVSQRGSAGNERSVICIRSLETGREYELFYEHYLEWFGGNIQWSPDNRFLLMVASDTKDETSHDIIDKIDVETGAVTRIFRCEKKRHIHYVNKAVWSCDGKRIYYVLEERDREISRLLSRDLNSGAEKELYRIPDWDAGNRIDKISVSLSPEGNWLAFMNVNTQKENECNIKIISSSGEEIRDLYSFKESFRWSTPIVWSVDGNHLLFARPRSEKDTEVHEAVSDNQAELWRISVDGGEPQRMGMKMFRLFQLSMHPDGKHLAFTSFGPEWVESELWVMENFLPEE